MTTEPLEDQDAVLDNLADGLGLRHELLERINNGLVGRIERHWDREVMAMEPGNDAAAPDEAAP